MRKIFLLLTLLFSIGVDAGVGGIYICSMDKFVKISKDSVTQQKGEKFTFKWTEMEIIFSSNGWFKKNRERLVINYPEQEIWQTRSWDVLMSWGSYEKGKLLWSMVDHSDNTIHSVIATCKTNFE